MPVTTITPAVAEVIDAHPLAGRVYAILAGLNRPGAFQAVHVRSDVAPAAASRKAGVVLDKEWNGVVRSGIEYANMAVNEGRETGPLPWGEWLIKGVLIAHKDELYVRVYVAEDSPRTVYRVNGREVPRDVFQGHLTASQRDKGRPNGGTISVKVGNLTLR